MYRPFMADIRWRKRAKIIKMNDNVRYIYEDLLKYDYKVRHQKSFRIYISIGLGRVNGYVFEYLLEKMNNV